MTVVDWPLLLAGPIVRRVEPNLVAVWVALKEPRAVRLSIWPAPVDTGTGNAVFGDAAPLLSGQANTLRVGDNLHIAVVTATTGGSLFPGQLFAYNVAFGPPGSGAFEAKEDLKSLGLLKDQPGAKPTAPLKHRALGYAEGLLPAFATPAAELADLRFVHGSCRRTGANVPDMMVNLDELIEASRTDALARPQHLFLTGDQIYADDVPALLLHLCIDVGNQLIGSVEQLPISWVPPGGAGGGVRLTPADWTHFPAGARKAVVMDDARLSTVDGESHLFSLAEFCAMHLMVWANTLWPAELPNYGDLYWGEPLPLSQFDEVIEGLALPPSIYQLHTGLYEKSSFGLKQIDDDLKKLEIYNALNVSKILKAIAASEKHQTAFKKERERLAAFRDALPKVRRALANVATYMMFDDHEITDDWNLSSIWCDRVFTSPLGRTMLRNGLVGYLMCQGWGNDPVGYTDAAPPLPNEPEPGARRRLLELVPQLFPAGDDLPPARQVANEIDHLLGLDGSDPPVRWHYHIDGQRHRVLVFDNRTRRAFPTRTSPPANLSPSALRDQIPEPPLPAGIELLVVLAPLPLLGLPMIDELGGPIAFRQYDVFHYNEVAGMPGTNPDAAEAWSNVPNTLEAALQRLAPFRRIVVLSGDVHFACSVEMSYWFKGDTRPARIAQFTSSGVKNVWPQSVITLNRSFAFGQDILALDSPLTRLGWFENDPTPLTFPAGANLLTSARAKLEISPLLLPNRGWPEGTTVQRTPDWAWRVAICEDQRPPNQVPSGARPAAFEPAGDLNEPLGIDDYRQVALRHARQLAKVSHTRRVLFASNFGLVSFKQDANGLTARHDLYAAPTGGTAEVFTSHTVALDVPPEPMPTIGGLE